MNFGNQLTHRQHQFLTPCLPPGSPKTFPQKNKVESNKAGHWIFFSNDHFHSWANFCLISETFIDQLLSVGYYDRLNRSSVNKTDIHLGLMAAPFPKMPPVYSLPPAHCVPFSGLKTSDLVTAYHLPK